MTSKAQLLASGQAARNSYWAGILARARFSVALAIFGAAAGASVPAYRLHPVTRAAAISYAEAAFVRQTVPVLIDPAKPRGQRLNRILAPGSYEHEAFDAAAHAMQIWAGVGVILFGGVVFVWRRRAWIRDAAERGRDKVQRGAELVGEKQLARLVNSKRRHNPMRVGAIQIREADETRHCLIVGGTGAGKTTVIFSMLDIVEARGEHTVVHDVDGTYIARYFRPERGDIILNPADTRCAFWNPFGELRVREDASRLAAFLVPKANGGGRGDSIWTDLARLVVAVVILRLWERGARTVEALTHALRDMSAEEMRRLVSGTEAARVFQENADKATASVLFSLAEASRIVSMLKREDDNGSTVCFDDFYRHLSNADGPKPWIFLASRQRTLEATKPLLGCWLDSIAAAILDREPNSATRAWLVLDELPALPPSQSLLTLLPQGRKFGASIVIAFQAIGQLRERYGKDAAGTIVGQTATQFVMRLGDPDSCQWGASLLGQAEVETQRSTLSHDSLAFEGRSSVATSREIRSIVLDGEIASLPPLVGYLRLSGLPIAKVTIDRVHMDRRDIAPATVLFEPSLPLQSGLSATTGGSAPAPAYVVAPEAAGKRDLTLGGAL